MKVAIFGPNLSGAAQRSGNFHVHAADCGDCKHYGYGRKFGGDNDPGKSDMVIEATSKWDVADFFYGPRAGDFDGTVEENMSDFHFSACVDALPDMTDENKAEEAARAAQAIDDEDEAEVAEAIAKRNDEIKAFAAERGAALAAFDAEFGEAAPVVEAPRLTLVKHPLDAALAALAEVEANVGKVNAGHERHFPVYVAGLRAYIEALRADLDDDNIARRLAAAGRE